MGELGKRERGWGREGMAEGEYGEAAGRSQEGFAGGDWEAAALCTGFGMEEGVVMVSGCTLAGLRQTRRRGEQPGGEPAPLLRLRSQWARPTLPPRHTHHPLPSVLTYSSAVHNRYKRFTCCLLPPCSCRPQQNLGAVVRSAFCLGAAGVLACARNCAPLSPVVSKVGGRAGFRAGVVGCHVLRARPGSCANIRLDHPTGWECSGSSW